MTATGLSFINRATEYIKYFFKAGNEHDVHSPFVYNFITESLYKKINSENFSEIENLRKKLLSDKREIKTIDLGAGSTYDGKLTTRSISDIVSKFAKPPKYGRFLNKCVSYFKPNVIVELGTSLGISTMYLASGNINSKVYTLEGCPETALVANENFTKSNRADIESITGNFNETLPELLNKLDKVDLVFIDGNHTFEATINYFELVKKHKHPDTIIIFDDINWSEGMQRAWKQIKSDSEVSITIDFFMLGMVFFNKNLSKQDFVLRF